MVKENSGAGGRRLEGGGGGGEEALPGYIQRHAAAEEATGETDPCLSLSFLPFFHRLFLSALTSMSPVSLGPIFCPSPHLTV